MRAKDFNARLRGVLFEAKHHAQMGSAVWLYGWMVLRQTRQVGATGLVLGGRPVSYREIESETGFPRRTLERWMRVLRRAGYVETRAVPAGVVVRITKAKKFPQDFPVARNAEGVFGRGGRRPTYGRRSDSGELTVEEIAGVGPAEPSRVETSVSDRREGTDSARAWTARSAQAPVLPPAAAVVAKADAAKWRELAASLGVGGARVCAAPSAILRGRARAGDRGQTSCGRDRK